MILYMCGGVMYRKSTEAMDMQEDNVIADFCQSLRKQGLSESQMEEYMAHIELICVEHINAYMREKVARRAVVVAHL